MLTLIADLLGVVPWKRQLDHRRLHRAALHPNPLLADQLSQRFTSSLRRLYESSADDRFSSALHLNGIISNSFNFYSHHNNSGSTADTIARSFDNINKRERSPKVSNIVPYERIKSPSPFSVAATSPSSASPRRSTSLRQQHQDAVRKQLVVRSFEGASNTKVVVTHPRLASMVLPDHDESTTFELQDDPFVEGPSSCVRDANGALVNWPWLQQHRGQVWSIGSTLAAHPLDRLINLGLDKASADGKRGRKHPGVNAWFHFMEDELHLTAHRPMDPMTPLWQKLNEEWLFMRFACALVEQRHVTIGTVRNYCSAVQGWHSKEHGIKLAAGLKLERLPAMIKGLRRVFGDPEVKLRRGFAPQALRRAMDLLLDPDHPPHANIRAAIAFAFQGLLRSAEFCLKDGKAFIPKIYLTRFDIKELTRQRLIIMMTPCKNMKELGGKTSPIVIGGGGEFIDSCAEVINMLRVDPTAPGHERSTPLFRTPSDNRPLRYSDLLALLRALMLAIGENPAQFGTHSLRIGGATALFACGADETVIRTMGRWSSDIHRLYVRACFERCCSWTRRAGSTVVSDVAQIFDDGEDDDFE